jgi:hypothetical protein
LKWPSRFTHTDSPIDGRSPLKINIDGLLIDQSGQVWMSRWKCQKKSDGKQPHYQYTQEWVMVNGGVPVAIRMCEHIIDRYKSESGEQDQLSLLITATSQLWQFFLSYQEENYSENAEAACERIGQLALTIGQVIQPHKSEAQNKLLHLAQSRGKDSLGRPNPGAMATIVLAAITRLEERVEEGIGAIVAEYSLRKNILEHIRELGLDKIDHILVNVKAMAKYLQEGRTTMLPGHLPSVRRMADDLTIEPYRTVGSRVRMAMTAIGANYQAIERWNKPNELIDEITNSALRLVRYLETPTTDLVEAQELIEEVVNLPVTTLSARLPRLISSLSTLLRAEHQPFYDIIISANKNVQLAARRLNQGKEDLTRQLLAEALERIQF